MRDLADIAPTRFNVPAQFYDDPRGRVKPVWRALVTPRDAEEIAGVLAYAREHRIAVVPYGGGTGLVGGQFYQGAEGAVALSLAEFQEITIGARDVVVGAGVILDNLHGALNGTGRHLPLSLASSGTAQIGGLISTNAGGVHVIRYGTMGALVRGLAAVLPDGTRLDQTGNLMKDNTGYGLDRLLIGAEGSLGVITHARLKTVVDDVERHVILMPIASPAAALALLAELHNLTINAFELISGVGLEFRRCAGFDAAPIGEPAWSVLIEIAEPLETLSAIDAAWHAAIVASDARQIAALWQIRETIPLGNRHIGAIASHDIALPINTIPGFLDDMAAELAPFEVTINAFGHLGDGNLHYNLFPATGRARRDYDATTLSTLVYTRVRASGGTISAEHGIGRHKAAMMQQFGYGDKLAAMRKIKAALDPWNIMNPGVFFAEEPEPKPA